MSNMAYVNEGFSSMEENGVVENENISKDRDFERDTAPSYSFRHPIQSTKAYLKHILGDTKMGVHVLVCLFAIASWADLNSMWSELPQLVINLPERWDLPSYIIVISQIANIGPLIFVLLTVLLPNKKAKLEKVTSVIIILTDIVAVILVSFFWKHTSRVAGQEHSTALLSLNFVFALGDCTSSIAFYAFMSTLKPAYMATFFLGEGLSGMLPAFIALGQGVSDIHCIHESFIKNATYENGTQFNKTNNIVFPKFGEPAFSVQVYFIIIGVILLFSLLAFILLNYLTYCKSEIITASGDKTTKDSKASKTSSSTQPIHLETKRSYDVCGVDDKILTKCDTDSSNAVLKFKKKSRLFVIFPEIPCWKFTILMAITVVINMTLTTFLSSIQSYTTLPYGLDPYHMATNLSQIANPVACFLAVFVMASSALVIMLVFLLGEVVVVYIIYAAAMSPTPPLHGEDGGDVMIVSLWVVVTFLLIYAKVCVAGVMRENGRRALIWMGVATQAGSFIGAITGFVLVNHYKVFIDAPYC